VCNVVEVLRYQRLVNDLRILSTEFSTARVEMFTKLSPIKWLRHFSIEVIALTVPNEE